MSSARVGRRRRVPHSRFVFTRRFAQCQVLRKKSERFGSCSCLFTASATTASVTQGAPHSRGRAFADLKSESSSLHRAAQLGSYSISLPAGAAAEQIINFQQKPFDDQHQSRRRDQRGRPSTAAATAAEVPIRPIPVRKGIVKSALANIKHCVQNGRQAGGKITLNKGKGLRDLCQKRGQIYLVGQRA